jgi:hypothetical protein
MNRGTAHSMISPTPRLTWDELPAAVRAEVTRRTGTVHHAEPISAGLSAQFTAHLDTAEGQVFLKVTPGERAAAARREAQINTHVAAIAPRLRWEFETAGSHVLGFDHVTGRRAELTPGSPHLALLTTTLTQLAAIPAPPSCRHIDDRWADAAYTATTDPALFAGSTLLHTDLNPHNILVTDRAALLVDWSWPTQGAAWIDTACAALWLIAEGHTPAQAESWAANVPTWPTTSPDAIDAFTAVNTLLWYEIAENDPQRWKQQVHSAASAWRTYQRAKDRH